jgi:hypothetical protein
LGRYRQRLTVAILRGSTPRRWAQRPDRGAEPIQVYIAGAQTPDGSLEPIEIVVHQLHADEPIMGAATARQLARALMAAADDFDRIT